MSTHTPHGQKGSEEANTAESPLVETWNDSLDQVVDRIRDEIGAETPTRATGGMSAQTLVLVARELGVSPGKIRRDTVRAIRAAHPELDGSETYDQFKKAELRELYASLVRGEEVGN